MVADVTDLASARVAYQQRVEAKLAAHVASSWAQLGKGDLDAAWRRVGPRVKLALVFSQRQAAQGAAEYVDHALSAQGAQPARLASVPADAFAGYAADGRNLEGALVQPFLGVKADIRRGLEPQHALDRGERRMLTLVRGEVGNTARVADGTAIALEPEAHGYVRRVGVPACGRCLVLAGKFFARNAGFKRHPRCDCTHVPVIRKWAASSPDALLDRMTPEQRVKALGPDAAKAVASGADLQSVVNATTVRRGLSPVTGDYTTAGAKRGQPRLTPAAVLRRYGDDPKRFHEALRANGYL